MAAKWSTGRCQCTHMALAFVVPCQAGGSVLLQPHGYSVACVLPAAQKIAERGRERMGRGKTEGGCEVMYDEGKCMSLPF